MSHHMEISLNPRRGTQLMAMKNKSIAGWLFARLFKRHRIVILFPTESVDMVTIIEQPVCAEAGGE